MKMMKMDKNEDKKIKIKKGAEFIKKIKIKIKT